MVYFFFRLGDGPRSLCLRQQLLIILYPNRIQFSRLSPLKHCAAGFAGMAAIAKPSRLPRRRQSPEKRPPHPPRCPTGPIPACPGCPSAPRPRAIGTACRCTVVCRRWASFTRISPVFITVSFVSALIRLDFPPAPRKTPAAPPTVPAEAALPSASSPVAVPALSTRTGASPAMACTRALCRAISSGVARSALVRRNAGLPPLSSAWARYRLQPVQIQLLVQGSRNQHPIEIGRHRLPGTVPGIQPGRKSCCGARFAESPRRPRNRQLKKTPHLLRWAIPLTAEPQTPLHPGIYAPGLRPQFKPFPMHRGDASPFPNRFPGEACRFFSEFFRMKILLFSSFLQIQKQ